MKPMPVTEFLCNLSRKYLYHIVFLSDHCFLNLMRVWPGLPKIHLLFTPTSKGVQYIYIFNLIVC